MIIVNPMLYKAMSMGFTVPPVAKMPLMVAGRLANFVNTWEVLTKDKWILQAVTGFQIPFIGQPIQAKPAMPVLSEFFEG